MTNEQARKVFDQIAATYRERGELDQAAQIELVREYYTNKKFRRALCDYLWSQSRFSKIAAQ